MLPDAADRQRRRDARDGYAPFVVRPALHKAKRVDRAILTSCCIGLAIFVAIAWWLATPLTLH